MSKPNIARFVAALALAGLTCFAYRSATIDPSGAYFGSTIVATVSLAVVGGRSRVLFTAIATTPPFVLLVADNFRLCGPADTLFDAFVHSAAGFGMTVAFPLLIAHGVTRLASRFQRA